MAETTKFTPFGKLVVGLGLAAAAFFSVRHFAPELLDRLAPEAKGVAPSIPSRADLPPLAQEPSPAGATAAIALPGNQPGCTDKPEVRMYLWAWNAQMGLMFANGGPQSTRGSLMCERGANVRFVREDDSGKMQEALVAFANELKGGAKQPTKGAHFVAIMGDGGATFLKGVNDTLKRLGPDYIAKVVGSAGYSRGEDKFMGPAAWKANPAASRGGFVAGVLRDGDWNIAQKWLGDNSLCNNPDEKTYDPNCLNWVNASDYIDAAQKYVANYCEDRPVVSGGKRTGKTTKICVNGVVTWTPGDVTVAQKRGGLVSIVSTKEYSSQMPHTIIGIDKWMRDNRPVVEGLLEATFAGGDQIKGSPAALKFASGVSAAVYHESGADGAYWEKYYRGTAEVDKTGLAVELGGSSANNLADNLLLFGLVPGSANLFGATYRVFGDIVVAQYPDLVPDYPAVGTILDTSYVEAIARRLAPKVEAEKPRFQAGQQVKTVVSRRAWHINFDSGKATFSPSSQADLQQLSRDLLVASSTVVEVHGHTDSAGTVAANQALSESRSFAVKQWLEELSPINFPSGRVRIFAHGQTNPIAPNSTAEGRAQNRRVEIVLGTTDPAAN